MLRVNEGIDPLLRRPFSICGTTDGEIALILYKIAGHGTEILSGKKAGEKLSVMGPLGQGFTLPGQNEKAVLVAGGIGIAPLYFLACALKDNQMEFMSGFDTSGNIISPEKIAGRSINISIATDDGSEGYSGMVTGLLDEYLDKNIYEKDSIIIYACGPSAMLKKVSSIAACREIPCQVSMEALMACGLGACQGCAVKVFPQNDLTLYRHVCKDGPVFPAHIIDWGAI
ncbi:MAG: dihydroorotate dehydrogenase electron transfer subunit [Deltaproteobacteria bacterium]|nr:dihydroorotate dehydrogenase electron transfer subunit [Deltaproteobacteria bacterium]